MSEVDRLSNSGLYPMLPIADRKGGKNGTAGKAPPESRDKPDSNDPQDRGPPRPPKSLIDEYA